MASRLIGVPRVDGNNGSAGVPWLLVEPGFQDGGDRRQERGSSFLAAFADRVDVGADAEGEVLAGESGEFGNAQPGLDGQRKHGMVTPTDPGVLLTGAQQRVDFVLVEVGDQVALGPFGRDRQHPAHAPDTLGRAPNHRVISISKPTPENHDFGKK